MKFTTGLLFLIFINGSIVQAGPFGIRERINLRPIKYGLYQVENFINDSLQINYGAKLSKVCLTAKSERELIKDLTQDSNIKCLYRIKRNLENELRFRFRCSGQFMGELIGINSAKNAREVWMYIYALGLKRSITKQFISSSSDG